MHWKNACWIGSNVCKDPTAVLDTRPSPTDPPVVQALTGNQRPQWNA